MTHEDAVGADHAQNATLQFSVSRRGTVALSGGFNGNFYASTCLPLVPQSDLARGTFFSVLYCVVRCVTCHVCTHEAERLTHTLLRPP